MNFGTCGWPPYTKCKMFEWPPWEIAEVISI